MPDIFLIVIFYSPGKINFRLRCMPLYFVLFNGDVLNIFLKASSFIFIHSSVDKSRTPGIGVNSVSVLGLLKRFQGQTSWQMSQPNIQFSNLFFISGGIISSFSSIVKYEIHLLPSMTLFSLIACVGQASIHFVQVPQ